VGNQHGREFGLRKPIVVRFWGETAEQMKKRLALKHIGQDVAFFLDGSVCMAVKFTYTILDKRETIVMEMFDI
jgi:hypothetical protein